MPVAQGQVDHGIVAGGGPPLGFPPCGHIRIILDGDRGLSGCDLESDRKCIAQRIAGPTVQIGQGIDGSGDWIERALALKRRF